MVKIILADDHSGVRNGLKKLLESEPDFNIVGEASDGIEAARIVEELKPDILVLDLMMPGMNGVEVTTRLSTTCPDTGIIILSMCTNEAYISETLRSGAKAYVMKDDTADDLVNVINQVNAQKDYVS
jgi:DNA-binding NarL/FixJ family response regulator